MAFNKKEHLKHNIETLQIAFQLEQEKRQATETERKQLQLFSGFGGLKFVLNPVESPDAINQWVKSEQDLFPFTLELHQLLRQNASDEKQYRLYFDSIRSSVLTAFYTPSPVIEAISNSLQESGISIERFLEPSAGRGSFLDAFKSHRVSQIDAYEKEVLTGKILKQLHPSSKIHVTGFEEIPNSEKESYDVIASNIPFGDTSVFDLYFIRGQDDVRKQAARSIHNYFFLKGTDMLREGGILVFITSQGVLNSPKNEPIRRALMQNNNLISAIRLPNNLFTDFAGTEVGSDLIVLQKNTGKQEMSKLEEQFCQTYTTSDNTSNNLLFENLQRIVHTTLHKGTDMYGKPASIYEHRDGVEGIAKDLKQMLIADLSNRLDINLYNRQNNPKTELPILEKKSVRPNIVEHQTIKREAQNLSTTAMGGTNEVQLSLLDLFENEVQTIALVNPTKLKKQIPQRRRAVIGRQGNLFNWQYQTNPPPTPTTPFNSPKSVVAGDLFSGVNGNSQNQGILLINDSISPTIYTGKIESFHRSECLVVEKGLVGYLKDLNSNKVEAIFHPLQLHPTQRARAESYIQVRDTYLDLYQKEVEKQREHKQERETLNQLYDTFVKRYGTLNNAENIKLIKTDSAGKEIPYLERVVGGVVHKADIFH